MTQLEQQMQAELIVTQTLTNYLANYLTIMGVQSSTDEGLDTLVPKVLTISTGGTVGTGAPLYPSAEDSDVAGYKKIKYTPDATETTQNITLTSTEQLIRTYLFDLPIGTTTIDVGNWLASVVCKISNAAGTSKLRIEPFLRHLDGSETTLFSKESPDINNTDYEPISADYPSGSISCLATDRLGFRVYGSTSGANRTLTTKIGDGNLSFFATPLSIRHDQTRDKNGNPLFLHIDATTTKETLVEDDKVAIYDSVTGKVVLTDKSNVEGINKLLPLIYAGL